MLEMRRFMCRNGRRGERGDGSICVVLMRESKTESERKRVPACICLIYHSAAVLFSGSFEAHSLSHLVRGLPAVCMCVYMYMCFMNEGILLKKKTPKKTGCLKRSQVRVDDRLFHGRHSCTEIPLRVWWLSKEQPHKDVHTRWGIELQ